MNDILAEHSLPHAQKLTLLQGDITQEKVDAIVNAANEKLLHGGGVAALIVRAGGRVIQEESAAWFNEHGPVSHAEPAYTSAGSLPARYIIHAVGPTWGSLDEEEKLSQAIHGSLNLAAKLELESIAFPAISTGIFGFPVRLAAQVILQAFHIHFKEPTSSSLNDIRLVVYDLRTTDIFSEVWDAFHNQA